MAISSVLEHAWLAHVLETCVYMFMCAFCSDIHCMRVSNVLHGVSNTRLVNLFKLNCFDFFDLLISVHWTPLMF